VTPRNAPASLGPIHLGPWVYRSFTNPRINVPDWIALSDYLLNALGQTIKGLGGVLSNFPVVNTFGILTPAQLGETGNSNDWLNEIHSNRNDTEKMANADAQA
jgi:hypothetical protein